VDRSEQGAERGQLVDDGLLLAMEAAGNVATAQLGADRREPLRRHVGQHDSRRPSHERNRESQASREEAESSRRKAREAAGEKAVDPGGRCPWDQGSDQNEGPYPLRIAGGERERRRATPAVSGENHRLQLETIEQFHRGGSVVAEAGGRPATAPVAEPVGNDYAHPVLEQRDDRRPIGRSTGLPMEQEGGGTATGIEGVQLDATILLHGRPRYRNASKGFEVTFVGMTRLGRSAYLVASGRWRAARFRPAKCNFSRPGPVVPRVQAVILPNRRAFSLAVLAFATAALLAATLAPAAGARAIHFGGRTVQAPGSWPVYRLARHPGMCVRLDRRAVYLGTPAADQRCPAGAMGRRRAIVVEPGGQARSSALAPAPRRLAAASGGAVFTGLGFDACSAPSSQAMSAWRSSPYRAVGVYIGGANRACSQPNLTSSWVAAQTAAGWNLIPTYVGLQAPTSSCSSCAKLTAGGAGAQGEAAALDAVEEAETVAIGPGSPIYFDMESYSRTSSATAATLAFLEAWTEELHALGYVSGVYSSSSSGIADLSEQVGSGYTLPDDLWIANWNGAQNTADPAVPAGAWTPHRRIHQYQGGHNETYGGVTINIDGDYVDGAVAGSGSVALPGEDDPVGYVDFASSPAPGQIRVRGWAYDPDAPSEPLAIQLTVGGEAGHPGAAEYELGPVASRPRRDVLAEFPEAGSRHGFDVQMPTTKSGRQRVCAYALDIAPGEDRLLGCKGVTIGVPIRLSGLHARHGRVRVRVTCQWPAGVECPGQVLVRARFRVPVRHYRGHGPRTRRISRLLGRTPFHLEGGGGATLRVPLTRGGRTLLRRRGSLKAQVLVAIPGGRRIAPLALRR